MSVALRPPSDKPELELVPSDERAVHYLEHGFPSELVRWHCHDDYELHLIVASTGRVFVGDHVGHFAPGHLMLVGPRLPHNWISQVEPGGRVELRDRVIQFREQLIPALAREAPEIRTLMPLLERSRYGIQFTVEAAQRHGHLFEQVRDTDGALRIALLIGFLQRLAEEADYSLLSTMPMTSSADDAQLDKVERVTRYVMAHHADDIPLSDAARLVGMSDSAFSRFFTKATGNGFTRFLNRVRVAKACELLSGSDEPITAICYAVGFNNVANFNRRFRDIKAVTPREYRRQTRLRHGSVLNAPDGDHAD